MITNLGKLSEMRVCLRKPTNDFIDINNFKLIFSLGKLLSLFDEKKSNDLKPNLWEKAILKIESI